MNNTKQQNKPIFELPKKLHRYDEQLRGDDKSDPLLVDLSATLQKPYCDTMAKEIMRRWNCHEELLQAVIAAKELGDWFMEHSRQADYAHSELNEKLEDTAGWKVIVDSGYNGLMASYCGQFEEAIAKTKEEL